MHRRTLSLTTPPTNTVRGRFFIVAGVFTLVTLVYIFTPRSIIQNHVTGNYPYVRPSTPQIYAPTPEPPGLKPAPEKLIVKVQLEGEDLKWLLKLLPDWRNQVITIDKSFASLHESGQRVDKGRIADAYLGWLITNYNRLPSTLVLIPPNLAKEEEDKGKWRLPYKSLVQSIQDLQIPHVQKEGYASLHCPTKQECEDTILPFRAPPDEYRTLEVKMAKAWEQMFNNTDVPSQLASPSGNAFVVSREQVRKRSVDEYTRFWTWINKTKMDDDSAGAVVERLWHVIFGREGVWCSGEETCQCEVFGRC
ncbi:hypothetical protein N0V91_007972 [Didymella pomorum]|jgi:hypothetical protein|uniref:Uncharacterized protein n=1 Tax=Didymella pomorum TaxID=749634 RepID=A0A9W8Z852_9PLEO|nr:hypothetical protein N0V91_007972 [Didymella pomorum]